ncbi:putative hemin import ATP-binding protein HmuV [Acetobacteraceae bacterium AT-5844]|nr:putative hemin import ATP-binding protein HmuV [Acetobacteraceae bacterium AT-5844]
MSLALRHAELRRGRRMVLQDVTLRAQAGRLLAIIGPNGAGKTSALSLLSGAATAESGDVLLDEAPLARIGAGELARRRAVVSQGARIAFPFRVHEAIALGRAPHQGRTTAQHDATLVEEAMARFELLHLAERSVPTLSGGEQQRVQLARAFVQLDRPMLDGIPRWLLLDEPVTGLDPAHQVRALAEARRFADAGGGVIAVLHDLRLAARYADDVALIENGRCTVQDTPDAVLTPGRIRDAFGLDEDAVGLFVSA